MAACGAKLSLKRKRHLVTDHECAEMELARTDKKNTEKLIS
jgi:hypothetical protein